MPDWNASLTPLPAPGLRAADPAFGGGAEETLRRVTEELVPALYRRLATQSPPRLWLAGYSLGGLFALWALYRQAGFAGAACCSGSLWYDGWVTFAASHPIHPVRRVYLSLGKREPHAHNPRMAQVGTATEATAALLRQAGAVDESTLQWNPGGHFTSPDARLAGGMAWLLRP